MAKHLLEGQEQGSQLPGQCMQEQGGLEQGSPYLLRHEAPS